MLGIGGTELVIILLFGFLIFGPDKLPQMGRTIGRGIRQFRHAQEEMNKVVRQEVYDPSGDNEPLSDSISGIFKEFTGDGKKEKSEKGDKDSKTDSSTSVDAETKSEAAKDSSEKSAGPSKDSKIVKKQEVKGETFAQKKARLAREKAEREKAKQEKSQEEESGEDK